MTPEAMRRLADLQLEKQFGIRAGNAKPREMAAPKPGQVLAGLRAGTPNPAAAPPARVCRNPIKISSGARQRRPESWRAVTPTPRRWTPCPLAQNPTVHLRRLLSTIGCSPNTPVTRTATRSSIRCSRAYDELGRTEEAIETMERLIRTNPHSAHFDEVQFRRGEYFFTRRRYRDAENAYSGIVSLGLASEFHELALYKLGWTLYKQEFYEEALQKYIALLDYKISIGYDFESET